MTEPGKSGEGGGWHSTRKYESRGTFKGEGTYTDLLCVKYSSNYGKDAPLLQALLYSFKTPPTALLQFNQRWLNVTSTGKNFIWLQQPMLIRNYPGDNLSRAALVGLAEEEKLGLVIN